MRAEDVLRMQADLRTQLLSGMTHRYVGRLLEDLHGWDMDERLSDKLGEMWCMSERDTLAEADSYMVTVPMQPLIHLDTNTRPLDTVLTESMLPSRHGFLVFENGLEKVDNRGRTKVVRAMSWHYTARNEVDSARSMFLDTQVDAHPGIKNGLLVHLYRSFSDAHRDWYLDELIERFSRETLLQVGEPHLVDQFGIPFDVPLVDWLTYPYKDRDPEESDWSTASEEEKRERLWRCLYVISLFDTMQQTVMVDRAPVPMTPKRREGWQRRRIPARISIVTLRRAYAEFVQHVGTAPTYDHRWKVRAHPHKYRVGPGRKETVVKWVESYEKGNPDGPLVDRPKVTKLSR